MNHKRHYLAATVACLLCCSGRSADAQQSYGSYYEQTKARMSPQQTLVNPTRFLYDKYFYNRSTVSPYMNLGRRDPLGSTSYYAYIRPEQDRRAQATQPQRPQRVAPAMPANPYYMNPTPQSRTRPTAYYQNWYGSGAR